MQPYLEHFPYTAKGLHFGIIFLDSSEEFKDAKFIAKVSLINSNIYYSIYNHTSEKFELIHKESYSEAFEPVKNSQDQPNLRSVNK